MANWNDWILFVHSIYFTYRLRKHSIYSDVPHQLSMMSMRQTVFILKSPLLGKCQHHIQEDQAATYMVRPGDHLLQDLYLFSGLESHPRTLFGNKHCHLLTWKCKCSRDTNTCRKVSSYQMPNLLLTQPPLILTMAPGGRYQHPLLNRS